MRLSVWAVGAENKTFSSPQMLISNDKLNDKSGSIHIFARICF